MSMSLESADLIIKGAREYAAREGLAPLTVVVLDAGAHVKAVAREDGAAIRRFEIAHGKANGALSLGVGSRALMERAEAQAYFIAAATSAIGGHLVPVPGGVLIRTTDGTLIGAVGISGDASDADEAACVAGIEAAGLVAQIA